MRNEEMSAVLHKANNKPLTDIIRIVLICALSAAMSIAISKIGIGKENALMVFLMGALVVTAVTKGWCHCLNSKRYAV